MPVLDWTVITVSKPAHHLAWTHSLRDGAHLLVNQHVGGWYSWELMTRTPMTDQRGRAVTLEDAQRQAELAAAAQGLVDIDTEYARPDMDRAQVASLIDMALRDQS
jgi:hypothetical protein